MSSASLAPSLSPHGRLALVEAPDAQPLEGDGACRIGDAFARGAGHGLLQLGAAETGTILPPVFTYWREFAERFVTAVCADPDSVPVPPDAELQRLVMAAPPMTGAEYLTTEVLGSLWRELETAFGIE